VICRPGAVPGGGSVPARRFLVSKPVAHYSPSARAGDLLFVSGQLGLAGGALADGVEAQTRQALVNLEGVLADNGAALTDVVKCTVFMTDIENFAAVNEVYASVFGDHRPARSAIAVKALPLGGLVEIEAFAHLGES
jgi:2-iminobutanoate/2-iminopropanoate deaminase